MLLRYPLTIRRHPVRISAMSIRTAVTLILAWCFAASVSAEPRLTVQLDQAVIYEGESFHYRLTIINTSPIGDDVAPDTSVWNDFNLQLLGTPRGQTIRSINGVTTVEYEAQFRYILTPKRAGSLAIPTPTVTVNSRTLLPQSFIIEGRRQSLPDASIPVRVAEPDDQDIVFMTIETSRSRLYPLQPLEVTLVIQIKGVPGRFAERDPLSLLQQPPQLQIPWAENDPQGFLSPQRLHPWLEGFGVQSHGFTINDYTTFNLMRGRVPAQFSSTPQKIRRGDALYWEYRFTRTLIPQEFGNYSFGPVSLKGVLPFADPANPGELPGQRIYAVARPMSVAIVDVPLANRPTDYIGAFGSFRWDATITPTRARVGDPMTLTLRLSGQGSTANVRPIDLSANPDIAANFRVHPPTEEIGDQSCTYTYTIRPLNPGAFVFPPIFVSVFDVNTERFISLQSLPIPLEIADSEVVQSPTLFGSVPDVNVQRTEGELFGNKTVLMERLLSITFIQWVMAVSVLLGVYVVITVSVSLLRWQRKNPKQQRQRGALNRAKSRLSEISAALQWKDPDLVTLSGELQGVFFGYIADKTDGVEQGMTTSDVWQHLVEHRVPEALANAIKTALESLDAVRYGGLDIRSLDEPTTIAGTLLRQLENGWHKRADGR